MRRRMNSERWVSRTANGVVAPRVSVGLYIYDEDTKQSRPEIVQDGATVTIGSDRYCVESIEMPDAPGWVSRAWPSSVLRFEAVRELRAIARACERERGAPAVGEEVVRGQLRLLATARGSSNTTANGGEDALPIQ